MRTRLGFRHLSEHKLKDGFKDTLNLLCSCSIEAETTTQYFPRCHFCNANRATLMNYLENISISFSAVSDNQFCFYMIMISSMTQRIRKY